MATIMEFTLYNFFILFIYTLIFMAPAYTANMGGLFFGGGPPLDCNKNFIDGKRLIGDGVTLKGLILGSLSAMLVSLILWFFIHGLSLYSSSPLELQNLFDALNSKNILDFSFLGLFLGFGALIGDALGSFLKRRLNLDRGRPAPILDQTDFAIVALLFASLVVPIKLEFAIFVLLITIFLHLFANIFAYLIGMKDVWY